MSWTQKLAYAFGVKSKPDPLAHFKGRGTDDRIQETLLQNPAIGGDLEIATEIMSSGDLVGFRQGEQIVEQGANNDDVYFLLAGEADILVRGRKRTFRGAPNQIGEMAAIEPGKARAATVQVRSETACALRIPGEEFRKVWNERVEFKSRLQVEMASRHREQLAAGQIVKENMSLLWFGLSIAAATIVGAIAWLVLTPDEWTLAARSLSTGLAAIATFVFVLLQNPAFIWRRSFSVLLWCLVGKSFFDTSISIEASQGFGSLQFELLPGGVPADVATSIGTSLPIVFVMIMCLWKDHLESAR